MQIPDTMRKSVVFVYTTIEEKREAGGTALIAAYPTGGPDGEAVAILLTAAHVINEIREKSDDEMVLIRYNTNTIPGGKGWFESHVDDWTIPDPKVDVAVHPWPRPADADQRGWGLQSALDRVKMHVMGIGIGDDVFTVGLFRNHRGQDRNEPIVRVGNIAAIPSDPVETQLFGPMRAILIESRSIGGLSGSPCFVHMGYVRRVGEQVLEWRGELPFHLLGLIHGHWDALGVEVDGRFMPGGTKVNMGIAIVVPADDILEAINPYMATLIREGHARSG